MIFQYFCLSISIVFISFIVGMIVTELIKKTALYESLSHLHFIKNERVHQIIGVGVFRWLVKNTFLKFFNQKIKLNKDMDVTDLQNIHKEMTKAEVGHLIGFLFVILVISFLILQENYLFAGVLFTVNAFANLYPSLLQQLTKSKLDVRIAKESSIQKS